MTDAATTPAPEQDTILRDPHTVEIQGRTYTVRPLGLRDAFKIIRIFGRGVAVLGDVGNDLTPGQAIQLIMASMSTNEEAVLDLLSDVIGVTKKELEDPALFPMASIVDVIQALAHSQDLKDFFAKLSGMMESNPEMQTASQRSSSS